MTTLGKCQKQRCVRTSVILMMLSLLKAFKYSLKKLNCGYGCYNYLPISLLEGYVVNHGGIDFLYCNFTLLLTVFAGTLLGTADLPFELYRQCYNFAQVVIVSARIPLLQLSEPVTKEREEPFLLN